MDLNGSSIVLRPWCGLVWGTLETSPKVKTSACSTFNDAANTQQATCTKNTGEAYRDYAASTSDWVRLSTE